jgi:hypothetical protein
MSSKRTALLAIVLLLTFSAAAQDLNVDLEVGSVSRASAPRMLGDRLLFTYEFGPGRHNGRINTVAVAFEHEEFSRVHPFKRNDNDIYVLLIDVPQDVDELHYRLVVNGIWTTDPSNPDSVVDRWGVELSRTVVPRPERTLTEAPIAHDDGTVEFIVTAAPGARVALVGSFNGWDPFMTPLREVEPGVFSRRLRLGRGEHLYYYVVDGLRIPDPLNERRKWHTSGLVVSVVRLN